MSLVKAFALLILAVVALSACAAAGDEVFYEEAGVLERESGAPSAFPAAETSADIDGAGNQFGFSQLPERLIISSGILDIVVEDTEAVLQQIIQQVEGRGGWIVSSNVFDSGGYKSGSVLIRVPAERFNQTLSDIKKLALEVSSEQTDSQDVTEEYVDLDSRLTNLEATAERVRGFLEEAKNVEEALAVNRELSQLESEIEVIKGRMTYLSQSAAFASLQVHITPDELNQPLEVGGWRPEGIARSAIEALISLLQGLAGAAIWLGIFCLPLAIIFGIPAVLVIRFGYRRWRRRTEAEKTLSEEEE